MGNLTDETRRKTPAPDKGTSGFSLGRFLESTGGAALITVTVGGLFGTALTAMIQAGLKQREFQQVWLKSRGDQALVAYKDHLDGERKNMERSFEEIGKVVAAADNLIILTRPQFNPTQYGDSAQRQLITQKDAIRREFNTARGTWRRNREVLGFLVSYYHDEAPNIQERWHEVQEAVDWVAACAEAWYLGHAQTYSTAAACEKEGRNLDVKMAALGKEIAAAQRYAWEGWESPARMKEALDARIPRTRSSLRPVR